jgi:nucleoside-diphosphate-sugar epimerase
LSLVLVTGVAGFIGSHLAQALATRGDEVRGLDNFSTGRRKNLADMAAQIDVRVADLTDAELVNEACLGVETIFHLGALPSSPRSVKEPRPSHETNLDGTFNLLEAARAAGVKRVIFASSSSAYGRQSGNPRVETMTPAPIAPYPVQKLAGELYMQSYWQVYGLETVCLRFFNIFGPRQVSDSPYSGVIARFILQMLQGQQPVLFGDGEQGRDFTYIANAVQASLRAAAAPAENVAGKVFNVACGQRHTLNETFHVLAKLIGYQGEPAYAAAWSGDARDSYADISAARSAFGYDPEVGFEEGLRRTVAWYQDHASAPAVPLIAHAAR